MIRFNQVVAGAILSGGLLVASAAVAQTNEQTRKDVQADTKQAEKADKAQAKADKSAHKAAKSDKVKKAARDQDKADREASKVPATSYPQ